MTRLKRAAFSGVVKLVLTLAFFAALLLLAGDGLERICLAVAQNIWFVKPEQVLEAGLRVSEVLKGRAHPCQADLLRKLDDIYSNACEHARMLPVKERLLELSERDNGPSSLKYLEDLESFYCYAGSHFEDAYAQPSLFRLLSLQEARFGPDSPEVIETLNDYVRYFYINRYDLVNCEKTVERVRGIIRRRFGANSREMADEFLDEGDFYYAKDQFRSTEVALQSAAGVAEIMQPPDPAMLVKCLKELRGLYETAGIRENYEAVSRKLDRPASDSAPGRGTSEVTAFGAAANARSLPASPAPASDSPPRDLSSTEYCHLELLNRADPGQAVRTIQDAGACERRKDHSGAAYNLGIVTGIIRQCYQDRALRERYGYIPPPSNEGGLEPATAETELRAIVDRIRKKGGDCAYVESSALTALVGVLGLQGRFDQCHALLEEFYRKWNLASPARDSELYSWERCMADLYEVELRFDESLALRRGFLRGLLQSTGPSDEDVLAEMESLAWFFARNGRLDDARDALENVSRIKVGMFGPDHPGRLIDLWYLALFNQFSGQETRETACYDELIELGYMQGCNPAGWPEGFLQELHDRVQDDAAQRDKLVRAQLRHLLAQKPPDSEKIECHVSCLAGLYVFEAYDHDGRARGFREGRDMLFDLLSRPVCRGIEDGVVDEFRFKEEMLRLPPATGGAPAGERSKLLAKLRELLKMAESYEDETAQVKLRSLLFGGLQDGKLEPENRKDTEDDRHNAGAAR